MSHYVLHQKAQLSEKHLSIYSACVSEACFFSETRTKHMAGDCHEKDNGRKTHSVEVIWLQVSERPTENTGSCFCDVTMHTAPKPVRNESRKLDWKPCSPCCNQRHLQSPNLLQGIPVAARTRSHSSMVLVRLESRLVSSPLASGTSWKSTVSGLAAIAAPPIPPSGWW